MKRSLRILMATVLAAAAWTGTLAGAGQEGPEDRTLSPYFFVKSDDPEVDRLPLRSTSATVNIAGVIADVTVTQVYKNEGQRPLEAIYVFPASTRAAVYGMKMTIGERIIIAKIRKKDEARQEYEEAKQQGKSASLLEQHRPNVFQMNVANIMPGDEIRVELRYTELLVPENGEYEFVYPTVVGPRYSNQPAESAPASEQWVQNPYLRQGEAPTYGFDMTVNIAAGLPIQQLISPSHKVDVRYTGPNSASVVLDPTEQKGGNRDYILKYRLAGKAIETGLLLFEGGKENFFLLMLQPPKRVRPEMIPGREYIFIVDISGSMHGFPIEISKKLLKDLIGKLRPTDRFNVLLFAGSSSILSERSLPATPQNIARAIQVIEQQRGGGGTELLPALKRALALPRAEGFSRSVVIATDGYVTVEEEAFDLIRTNLGDANFFTFGIGSSVNRLLLEGMARVGMGEPFVITKQEEAAAKAEAFRTLIQSPVLTGIRTEFNGFDVYDVEPASVPDVLADRPVIVFGKWRGKPRGMITVSGLSGDGTHREKIDVASATPSTTNGALRYLWARHRISLLSDYNSLRSDEGRIREVTELGLTYNLLTAFTSFLAVDNEVRNKEGNATTVTQPLPLPEGVSDYAVAGRMQRYAASPVPASEPKTLAQNDEACKPEEKPDSRKNEKTGMRIDDIRVTGALSTEAVRMVVEQQLGELVICAAGGLHQGRFVVRLVIDEQGRVKSITPVSVTPSTGNTGQCIIKAAKRWRFPAQTSGSTITLTIRID
ncbi:MAG: trypsin [Nitrospirae bacterium GWC2_57_13]|nr:MAG: trypsin [Nitrospirae bacterium GWC1_57_7]OGW27749.1 MAG: trypsin [Nitrospirae bacterium GWC2_57_13]HAR46474.1 trypsin [Nitrospiraceae bacterium]